MKPIIGITSDQTLLSYTILKNIKSEVIWQGFTDSVIQAGGLPIVLPFSHPQDVEHYVSMIDGLIVTGGQDVSPFLYDEEPHIKLGALSPKRDAMESALIKEAFRQNKPILGICRGLQLINVIFGGSLYQDLSQNQDFTIQHEQQSQPHIPSHGVNIEPNSWLYPLVGDSIQVNTVHHQAIHQLAEGFNVCAYSKDLLIEAIEHQQAPIYAVQWHPELLINSDEGYSLNIFKDFIQRCKRA